MSSAKKSPSVPSLARALHSLRPAVVANDPASRSPFATAVELSYSDVPGALRDPDGGSQYSPYVLIDDEAIDTYGQAVTDFVNLVPPGGRVSRKEATHVINKRVNAITARESIADTQAALSGAVADLVGTISPLTVYVPLMGVALMGVPEPFAVGRVHLVRTANVSSLSSESFLGETCAVASIEATPIQAITLAVAYTRRALDVLHFDASAGRWFDGQATPLLKPLRSRGGLQGEVPSTNRVPGESVFVIHAFTEAEERVASMASFDRPPIMLSGYHPFQETNADVFSRLLRKDTLRGFEEAILRALHWFADGQVQEERPNRLLSYVTCIEAFVNPSDRRDITYRLAENVALLLGDTVAERRTLRKRVKRLYDLRSRAVHGATPGRDVNDADVDEARRIAYHLLRQMARHADRFTTLKAFEEHLNDLRLSVMMDWPDEMPSVPLEE